MFLYYFNALILKIIFKNKKYYFNIFLNKKYFKKQPICHRVYLFLYITITVYLFLYMLGNPSTGGFTVAGVTNEPGVNFTFKDFNLL
jgi:hypothetical protein